MTTPTKGDLLKKKGMSLVYEASPTGWKMEVSKAIFSFEEGDEITAEDIRHRVPSKPHSPKAWGAIIHVYVAKGILVPTHKYTKAKIPSSHSRPIMIHTVCKSAAWGGK
jgi:hypothetical protein